MSVDIDAITALAERVLEAYGGAAPLSRLSQALRQSEIVPESEYRSAALDALAVDTVEEQIVFAVAPFRGWFDWFFAVERGIKQRDAIPIEEIATALDVLDVTKPVAAPWPGVFPPWWSSEAKSKLTERMLNFTLERGPQPKCVFEIVSWDGEQYEDD